MVISQGQSRHPDKRGLEEDVVASLMLEPGIDVTVIPHLYDLKEDETGALALQGIKGDVVVCSWLFDRAAHWVLDRCDVRGLVGKTLICSDEDEVETEDGEEVASEGESSPNGDDRERVLESRDVPKRKIYSLDFKVMESAAPYVEEVKRIVAELQQDVVEIDLGGAAQLNRIEVPQQRRWYPVIDFSLCTNCMECVDFCLFGVYGIDQVDTILVEQPDNCRKGCPACSRVCPENAIMFPQHKTPAIAGSGEGAGVEKIDLSKLFGAPQDNRSAAEIAAMERDEQLLATGQEAVGFDPVAKTAQVKVKEEKSAADSKNDELDDLMDELDGMMM